MIMDVFNWELSNASSFSSGGGASDDEVVNTAEAAVMATASVEAAAPVGVNLSVNFPKKRAGRKKFRETRHPVFRGVRLRNGGKWVCEVRQPGNRSRIWLGTYPTAEMAARAYDVAALAFHGPSACLNFADSARVLPAPDSADPAGIRKAATRAAEMYRPAAGLPPESSASAAAAAAGFDDEVVFGMPALLAELAEGLLMPPPPANFLGREIEFHDDVISSPDDVILWKHSV